MNTNHVSDTTTRHREKQLAAIEEDMSVVREVYSDAMDVASEADKQRALAARRQIAQASQRWQAQIEQTKARLEENWHKLDQVLAVPEEQRSFRSSDAIFAEESRRALAELQGYAKRARSDAESAKPTLRICSLVESGLSWTAATRMVRGQQARREPVATPAPIEPAAMLIKFDEERHDG